MVRFPWALLALLVFLRPHYSFAADPPSTQALKPIALDFSIGGSEERHLRIDADGNLIDNEFPDGQVRFGKLKPDESAELLQLLSGWNDLQPGTQPAADGVQFTIHYGDKTISGDGFHDSQAFSKIVQTLLMIANEHPAVGPNNKTPENYQPIVLSRTGGFAGLTQRITIAKNGVLHQSGTKGDVLAVISEKQLADLADAMKDFDSYKPAYSAAAAADDFHYSLKVGDKTITASEAAADLPESLKTAIKLIESMPDNASPATPP